MEELLDFNHSYLTWLTKNEQSYGRFRIDATLTIRDPSAGHSTTYYLLPEVMAGNVYGDQLIKEPCYAFQAIFSSEGAVKIFRTYTDRSDDSTMPTEEHFERIDFHVQCVQVKKLKRVEDIVRSTLQCKELVALIQYETENMEIEILFPVKHINVSENNGDKFQIETGPIMMMESPSISDMESLALAFVNFKGFDQVTYAVQYPRENLTENVGFHSNVKKSAVQISIYKQDE